jgi:Nucleotide modification associated domain 2
MIVEEPEGDGCSDWLLRTRSRPQAVMWSYFRSNLAPAAAGARSFHILEKSRFGEAEDVTGADDEVIDYAAIDQREAWDGAGRADRYLPAGSDQDRFTLISDDFYYFGRNAIHIARISLRHLDHPLEKRGLRHRHDFTEPFIADFERWIAREYAAGIHGEPCAGLPPHSRSRPRRCVPVRRRLATICHPKRC